MLIYACREKDKGMWCYHYVLGRCFFLEMRIIERKKDYFRKNSLLSKYLGLCRSGNQYLLYHWPWFAFFFLGTIFCHAERWRTNEAYKGSLSDYLQSWIIFVSVWGIIWKVKETWIAFIASARLRAVHFRNERKIVS